MFTNAEPLVPPVGSQLVGRATHSVGSQPEGHAARPKKEKAH